MAEYDPYIHALLWTCATCGFVFIGGQPKSECPGCASHKTAFIDIPQDIETRVREAFPDNPPNHHENRAIRLELMTQEGAREKRRVAGRILPAASGQHMNLTTLD